MPCPARGAVGSGLGPASAPSGPALFLKAKCPVSLGQQAQDRLVVSAPRERGDSMARERLPRNPPAPAPCLPAVPSRSRTRTLSAGICPQQTFESRQGDDAPSQSEKRVFDLRKVRVQILAWPPGEDEIKWQRA